jgi:putative ABC transport system permease protein
VGTLAGYYPALSMPAFKPIEVLKTKVNAGTTKSRLRNVLLTTQFALVLIVATMIVYQQLNFIQTTNLGFKKGEWGERFAE